MKALFNGGGGIQLVKCGIPDAHLFRALPSGTGSGSQVSECHQDQDGSG